MYAFDIIIKNNRFKEKHDQQYENWVHWSFDYTYHLERTGQIQKRNHPVIVNDNIIRMPVITPEIDSMDSRYCSEYNLEVIEKIEQNSGSTIETVYLGRDANYPDYVVPHNSSFYILRYGWASPLLCGDTHKPVPLYKIPCTDHSGVDFDNVYFWHQDYERLYGLWLSGLYEGFAEEQLSDPWSAINKNGRALCEIIEKITGVPTYYFLFNYSACSEQEDKQRKCPLTGNNWYIEGKSSSDFMAFKCDESRLVSELSTNSGAEHASEKNRYFELEGKLLNFTVDALDFRIKDYQTQMKEDAVVDDEYSDMANDMMVLSVIKKYLNGDQ